MGRGFLAGTLTLIVLYVVVQPGASSKADTASNWAQQGMRRWLAVDVAGVPDRTKKTTTKKAAAPVGAGRYYTV
jgi:hypothetical protein